MAPHIGRMGVCDGHVDRGSRTAHLLGRRNDRGRFLHQLAHAVPAGLMPQRGVLQLAVLADDGRLAVGDDPVRPAEDIHQLPRHGEAEGFQRLHERHQVVYIPPGIGVGGHRGDIALPLRCLRGRTELVQHLLDVEYEFPHIHQRPEIAFGGRLDRDPGIVHLSLLRLRAGRARGHRRRRGAVGAIRASPPRPVQRGASPVPPERPGRALRPPLPGSDLLPRR